MWNSIIRNFERSLILNSGQCAVRKSTIKAYLNNQERKIFSGCSTVLRRATTVRVANGVGESDYDYIVPYKREFEKREGAKNLMNILRSKFSLSKDEVEHILNDKAVIKSLREKSLIPSVDILNLEGVSQQNLIDYPWLIALDSERLKEKISLLKYINGFQDINDFVPFLRLQLPRLRKLITSLNSESAYMENENRLYFIAKKLNVSPRIAAKYLAKRLFVLEMPLHMFKANLQHMIAYNVEPINILKDLWGFRYAPRAVEMRLKRASQAKKDKIMPWMVRCPETILKKSLQLSLDELEIMGNKTSVAEYVGERLGFTTEQAQAIMNIHPQVNTVRVTKIKEILDYLLNEAKFTRYEVAQVPRILCHSLETTKQRIEELEKNGCRPSSLIIVCRSRKEYEKFLKQWQQNYKPTGSKNEVRSI